MKLLIMHFLHVNIISRSNIGLFVYSVFVILTLSTLLEKFKIISSGKT